jgi:hypothetical protein
MSRAIITASVLALACTRCDGCDDSTGTGGSGGVADGGAPSGGAPSGGGGAGSPPVGGAQPTFQCAPEALSGPIEDSAWDTRFTLAGIAGPDGDAPHVADFARDVDGSVLAAGRFRWLGQTSVHPLLRGDATQWENARDEWQLEPEPFGGLSAVAVGPAGELALATTGVSPQIWVDTGSGLESIATLADLSSFFQYVRALAWYDGQLWAAGAFTIAGGPSHLAVWNGASWSAPPGGAADGPVYELLIESDTLHVAGAFDDVGGIAAAQVATWNGSTWQALDLNWPGEVYALAIDASGNLAAGGFFSDEGGDCPTHGSVAQWTGTTWEMLGAGVSSPEIGCGSRPGWVYDIAYHKGDLYVTGQFSFTNGAATDPAAVVANNFARFADGAWESLDEKPIGSVGTPWVAFGTEGFGIIGQRLFDDGDRLLAGILSGGVDGVASPGLIAYQDGQWVPQGAEPQLGLLGNVDSLAVGGPDCAVHVAGSFTHAGGEALESPVLRFEAGAWTALGGAVPALRCDRVAVDGEGTPFVACDKLDSSGSELFTLAGGDWVSIGAPDVGGAVTAIAVDGRGTLWAVGGGFGKPAGAPSGFVARYRDGEWSVLADASNVVTHIAFSPDDDGIGEPPFVVGGGFTSIGGSSHARVAHFDDDGWTSLGDGLGGAVGALSYGRNGIYASEQSTGAPGDLIVGRWDGSEWVELATPANEFPELVIASPNKLVEVGSNLFVIGSLYGAAFPPEERGALVFDGQRFSWLAGGVGATTLSDAVATPDGIWIGGGIAEAGLGKDRVSAIGVARFGL